MTNRERSLHSSPRLIAESTLTGSPGKNHQAAIHDESGTGGFVEQVRINQQKLTAELKSHYDFIVCGSGSSGSVVARRLAENPEVNVLLLEAGGSDNVPAVMDASKWTANLAGERFWDFKAQPNPALQGRALSMSMGKVLGGGSSVNAMYWVRGHKNDWNYFADEAGDAAWNYESLFPKSRFFRTAKGPPFSAYPPDSFRRIAHPSSKSLRRIVGQSDHRFHPFMRPFTSLSHLQNVIDVSVLEPQAPLPRIGPRISANWRIAGFWGRHARRIAGAQYDVIMSSCLSRLSLLSIRVSRRFSPARSPLGT